MATPAIKGKIASVKQWTDSLFSLRRGGGFAAFRGGAIHSLGLADRWQRAFAVVFFRQCARRAPLRVLFHQGRRRGL